MIKLENMSKEKLDAIGTTIGEAYYAEDDSMIQTCFQTKEECILYFQILVKSCYDMGILYSISPKLEGFVAYYRKNQLSFWRLLKMLYHFRKAGLSSSIKAMGNMHPGWIEGNQKYKKEKDFVEVYMAVVPREYQGNGYLHKLLEDPFALARKNNIPCILDTNTNLKALKYQHCGMKVIDHKPYPNNVDMYTLEYR